MSALFAPMYVNYQHQEHYVFALVEPGFPAAMSLKRVTDSYDKDTFFKLEASDNCGVMFLGYQTGGIDKKLKTIPANGCEFIRFGDRCVMCGAVKESGG